MNHAELITTANQAKITAAQCKQLIPLLDLTSLNESDDAAVIKSLCEKALAHKVAAVCIYPQFVELTQQMLAGSSIKTCTVANFPAGTVDVDSTVKSIFTSMVQGAEEIDVVIPYQTLLVNDTHFIEPFVKVCKQACGSRVALKTIIESGVLVDADKIYQASAACIKGGADFIKTSTGKVAVNATLEAAAIMLSAIKELNPQVGFKAAGGIRTAQQAAGYLFLAEEIMGREWINSQHFRLGASSLLDDLLMTENL